jgi:hypothetical protein
MTPNRAREQRGGPASQILSKLNVNRVETVCRHLTGRQCTSKSNAIEIVQAWLDDEIGNDRELKLIEETILSMNNEILSLLSRQKELTEFTLDLQEMRTMLSQA